MSIHVVLNQLSVFKLLEDALRVIAISWRKRCVAYFSLGHGSKQRASGFVEVENLRYHLICAGGLFLSIKLFSAQSVGL
jgi:hypothetical protein